MQRTRFHSFNSCILRVLRIAYPGHEVSPPHLTVRELRVQARFGCDVGAMWFAGNTARSSCAVGLRIIYLSALFNKLNLYVLIIINFFVFGFFFPYKTSEERECYLYSNICHFNLPLAREIIGPFYHLDIFLRRHYFPG